MDPRLKTKKEAQKGLPFRDLYLIKSQLPPEDAIYNDLYVVLGELPRLDDTRERIIGFTQNRTTQQINMMVMKHDPTSKSETQHILLTTSEEIREYLNQPGKLLYFSNPIQFMKRDYQLRAWTTEDTQAILQALKQQDDKLKLNSYIINSALPAEKVLSDYFYGVINNLPQKDEREELIGFAIDPKTKLICMRTKKPNVDQYQFLTTPKEISEYLRNPDKRFYFCDPLLFQRDVRRVRPWSEKDTEVIEKALNYRPAKMSDLKSTTTAFKTLGITDVKLQDVKERDLPFGAACVDASQVCSLQTIFKFLGIEFAIKDNGKGKVILSLDIIQFEKRLQAFVVGLNKTVDPKAEQKKQLEVSAFALRNYLLPEEAQNFELVFKQLFNLEPNIKKLQEDCIKVFIDVRVLLKQVQDQTQLLKASVPSVSSETDKVVSIIKEATRFVPKP